MKPFRKSEYAFCNFLFIAHTIENEREREREIEREREREREKKKDKRQFPFGELSQPLAPF